MTLSGFLLSILAGVISNCLCKFLGKIARCGRDDAYPASGLNLLA